jgi:hypothetical protein
VISSLVFVSCSLFLALFCYVFLNEPQPFLSRAYDCVAVVDSDVDWDYKASDAMKEYIGQKIRKVSKKAVYDSLDRTFKSKGERDRFNPPIIRTRKPQKHS